MKILSGIVTAGDAANGHLRTPGTGDKYGVALQVYEGTLARKIIEETRPQGVVAIACERDLVGIKDANLAGNRSIESASLRSLPDTRWTQPEEGL